MNISSQIFPNGSNLSNHSFNGTEGSINFFILLDIMTIVLGVLTNSYVIWLILTRTGNGLAAEFFSLNLSICEMLLCLNTCFYLLPSWELMIVAVSGQGLALTGRPLFQSLISVERYLAVVHPVTFLKFKPLRYRAICCVVAWTAIFASCVVFTLFIFNNLIDLFFDFTLALLILFLSCQLFFCAAVLRALKQSGPGERRTEREEENHMKRRAFNVILIITVTSVIIYAPSIISNFFFMNSVENSEMVSDIAHYSYSLGGLVQPFLFLHRVRKLPFTT